MHNGNWNDGMGHGGREWLPVGVLMMVILVGGLICIGVTLLKRNDPSRQVQAPAAAPIAVAPSRQSPQEILAERLARGEIEPDDYRRRLDALGHVPT
jgi:putative membrane protein